MPGSPEPGKNTRPLFNPGLVVFGHSGPRKVTWPPPCSRDQPRGLLGSGSWQEVLGLSAQEVTSGRGGQASPWESELPGWKEKFGANATVPGHGGTLV